MPHAIIPMQPAAAIGPKDMRRLCLAAAAANKEKHFGLFKVRESTLARRRHEFHAQLAETIRALSLSSGMGEVDAKRIPRTFNYVSYHVPRTRADAFNLKFDKQVEFLQSFAVGVAGLAASYCSSSILMFGKMPIVGRVNLGGITGVPPLDFFLGVGLKIAIFAYGAALGTIIGFGATLDSFVGLPHSIREMGSNIKKLLKTGKWESAASSFSADAVGLLRDSSKFDATA